MPRPGLSTAMLAALAAGELDPAVFVLATFVTGPVYLWSGLGSITWNGQTWQGLGALGSISPIAEGTRVESRGLTLTLSGIDSTLIPDVLSEFQTGLPVTVYLGLFDEGALIASPCVSWAGRMDLPQVDIGGSTSTISINCESRLISMNTAVDRRYTPDDQQCDWPGDLGMSFVPSIQEMTLYWGSAPTSTGNI